MSEIHLQIEKVLTWYDRLPADFNDVDLLIDARRKLSTRLYQFACVLADLSKDKISSEHRRKAFEARRKAELIASTEKPVLSQIEAIVQSEAEGLKEAEAAAEAEFQAARIIYSAAQTVCDVMNQHIANLRAERHRDLISAGSQV